MIDQITESLYISDAASVLYNTHKLRELKVNLLPFSDTYFS